MKLLRKGLDYALSQEMTYLEMAILLASMYHVGQKDKAHEVYIKHPLAVMNRLKTDDERTAGVLHDFVEDTDYTIEDLREFGFPEHIIEAIISVTKIKGETYDEAIYRASLNPIGIEVKKADLKENSNIERIPVHMRTEEDDKRVLKYLRALDILENVGITWFWETLENGKMGWIKKVA